MTSVRRGEARATLRVLDEPFFITGRGLVVVCECVSADGPVGLPATATIPLGSGGTHTEEVAGIAATSGRGHPDRPALLFRLERGERETLLRGMLRPGAVFTVTGQLAGPRRGPFGPNSDEVQRFIECLTALDAAAWTTLDRVGWGTGHSPRAWLGRLLVYRALVRSRKQRRGRAPTRAELRVGYEAVERVLQRVAATPVQRGAVLMGLFAVSHRFDMDASAFRTLYGKLERVIPAARITAGA